MNMFRLKTGIDFPIVPEDFEPSGENLLSDVMKMRLEEWERNRAEDIYVVELLLADLLFANEIPV